jgi:predicted nucleic acid-binding protein
VAYLLDTNVLSETVKAQPDPQVVAWLEETPLGEAYLSALTWGELVQGVVRAPVGRKRALESWLRGVRRSFQGRILPLDLPVMEVWGRLVGEAFLKGQPLSPLDAMLAATALHHGLVLVTRNARHFEGLPIALFNPWGGGSFTWVTGVSPYLGSERQEGRWAERLLREANILRLKGFSEAREVLEKMLQERYAPRTQTLTHTS